MLYSDARALGKHGSLPRSPKLLFLFFELKLPLDCYYHGPGHPKFRFHESKPPCSTVDGDICALKWHAKCRSLPNSPDLLFQIPEERKLLDYSTLEYEHIDYYQDPNLALQHGRWGPMRPKYTQAWIAATLTYILLFQLLKSESFLMTVIHELGLRNFG